MNLSVAYAIISLTCSNVMQQAVPWQQQPSWHKRCAVCGHALCVMKNAKASVDLPMLVYPYASQ